MDPAGHATAASGIRRAIGGMADSEPACVGFALSCGLFQLLVRPVARRTRRDDC
jgi:hypothetical protein